MYCLFWCGDEGVVVYGSVVVRAHLVYFPGFLYTPPLPRGTQRTQQCIQTW